MYDLITIVKDYWSTHLSPGSHGKWPQYAVHPIPESLLRAAADFTSIHLSMLAAVALGIITEVLWGSGTGALVATQCSRYYWAQFWPLSVVFPLTFFFHGFYSRSRLYTSRYKLLVCAQGVAIGSLVFLAANFLIFRDSLIARRIILAFLVIALIVIPLSRLGKLLLFQFLDASSQPAARPASSRGKRVLVLGGAGYIGSILVRRLLEVGKTVRVLDSLIYGDDAIRSIKDHPRFELIVGDCRNIQSVVSALCEVDTIVDLAAIVGDPACDQDRQSALEINYAATRMIIEIAKGHGIRQFIFASTCSVYGATEQLADENAQTNPLSLYAQTKIDSEKALLQAASSTFSPVILRFATVFGHSWRPRFDLVVNLLTAKAFQDSLITIYNGQQWRPFIHVRDVAESIVKVLDAPISLTAGEIYNIGDSRLNHTLTQVAEEVLVHFPHTRVEHVENTDRRNYRISFEKVRKQLGFECSIDLNEGIREMHAALQTGAISDYSDCRFHNQRFLQQSRFLSLSKTLDGDIMAAFSKKEVAKAAAS